MAASLEKYLYFAGAILFISPLFLAQTDDEFSEELFMKPLPTGHLYSHFQFTTAWNVSLDSSGKDFSHFHLFPKSFGEIVEKYHVRELHLSLTAGLWRHEKWGFPLAEAPPGAELWVWFKEGTRDVDQVWTDLINVLSGLFCASLNFMDSKTTVVPRFSFRPQGVTSEAYNRFGTNLVKYAALAGENVCTENLTPWKKLLPCGSKAGLATLFNAGKIYDTSYNSIGLHFRPVCQNEECDKSSVELSQTLALVFEPVVVNRGKYDWNLRELFGRNLANGCPLAKRSKIYIDTTSNKTLVHYFMLSPQPHETVTLNHGGQKVRYAMYDIPQYTKSHHVINLGVKYNRNMEYTKVQPPVVHAHRYQTGFGQEKGGVACLIYNHHPSQEIPVIVMETLPWYLRTYLHTLKIERYSSDMKANENGTEITPVRQHFVPARDRQTPYFLELVLKLQPNSVTKISFEFERALLTWTEYPPDANHGFYINSAVISAVLPDNSEFPSRPPHSSLLHGILRNATETPFVRLHTESLLITLPTPDFSMPYNVICLACTVVAIAFGSVHNLTTRRFVILDPTKQKGLLTKIKGFFSRKKIEEKKEEIVLEKKEAEEKKEEGSGDNEDKDDEESSENSSQEK